MIVLYLLSGMVLLYLFLIVCPAVTAFFSVFSRKDGVDPDEIDPSHSYYAPYLPEMREAASFLRAQKSTQVSLTSRDGIELAADWYDSGAEVLAICMHGFRSTPLTSFCVLGKELKSMGCDLLLVQQRAHGRSQGKRSTLGLLESGDLLEWIEWAQQHTGAKKLLLCGISMGAAAVALASDKIRSEKVRAMILDCGFASPYEQMIQDCGKWHLPGRVMVPIIALCARLVLHVDLKTSSCDSLARTKIPAFFLHGTADISVTPAQGQKCFAACASEKELLLVDGAQHTVSLMAGGEPAKQRIRAFVRKYVFRSEAAESISGAHTR